jgi:hypothetical protein
VKLLMFYAPEFWFKTYQKVLTDAPDQDLEHSFRQAAVIFYHAEAEDVGREEKVITKWVKNAKWIAGKFATRTIVLHSFNHLSQSKAPLETAQFMVDEVRRRLERAEFSIGETPFGYLNEWKIHVAGESLAKVFKDI